MTSIDILFNLGDIVDYSFVQVGVKLAEMCERLKIKHVIYSAVDFVFRITGNRLLKSS